MNTIIDRICQSTRTSTDKLSQAYGLWLCVVGTLVLTLVLQGCAATQKHTSKAKGGVPSDASSTRAVKTGGKPDNKTIPKFTVCRLNLKDVQGKMGLVDVPGSRWKQMSLRGIEFDEEKSYFECGKQKSKLLHFGDSLMVAEPVTFKMVGSDPLTYASNWAKVQPKSQSVLWVEPGEDPNVIIVSTDLMRIPPSDFEALGIPLRAKPNLRLQFHFVANAGGVFEFFFLFGEGTEYWGATKGYVKMGGKKFTNLKGARIVNGQLR